jgi:hypothetical protein
MGPKHGMILAIVSNVHESNCNLNTLIQLIKLNEIDFKLSQDLKLTNIIIGIQSHSSKYPCPYGECFKNLSNEWEKGENRTVNNLNKIIENIVKSLKVN